MTGAKKRAALLALAAKSQGMRVDMITVTLTHVSGLPLDDAATCQHWTLVFREELWRATGTRERLFADAMGILRGVMP